MRKATLAGLALLLAAATAAPADAAAQRRLPKGYHWGRCLLVADGKSLINGRCIYRWDGGGAFYMTGPRQIFEGIDYRNPGGFGAGQRSADYWARVFRDADGRWTGYASPDRRSTHGGPMFGPLTQRGACFSGRGGVRVCLWRE